jgi:hypothetical protein
VTAFVIFETQECQERCFNHLITSKSRTGIVKYNERALTILGEKLEVEPAPEPSDITWENQAIGQRRIYTNSVLVTVLMTVFLFALCAGFTVAKHYGPMTYLKYPPSNQCDDVADLFESLETFEEHASEDKEATLIYKGRGYYQCYCKLHSSVQLLLGEDGADHLFYTYQSD